MPRDRMHDIQVAIRMPEALRDRLLTSAAHNNRSLAAEVRRAVELYLGEKTRRGTR